MTREEEIAERLDTVRYYLNEYRGRLSSLRKEMFEIESLFISLKLEEESLEREIKKILDSRIDTSFEDDRAKDLERFKARLPNLLARLDNPSDDFDI